MAGKSMADNIAEATRLLAQAQGLVIEAMMLLASAESKSRSGLGGAAPEKRREIARRGAAAAWAKRTGKPGRKPLVRVVARGVSGREQADGD